MRIVRRAETHAANTAAVGDLMATNVVTIDPRVSLTEAAAQMRGSRTGSLIVLAGIEITGIITEHDFMRAIADGRDPAATHVSQYMTQSPRAVEIDLGAAHAAALMVRHAVRHLPVTRRGQLVGILSARDLLALKPWPARLPSLEAW